MGATTAYAAPLAVAKSAPCVNAANIPVPCNAGAVLAAPAIAAPAIAAPAIATTGVIGGYSTLGGHYYGKREAEADAEPLLLGAGYAGLAGAAIAAPAIATTAYAAPIAVAKSAPCVNAANVPVPCNCRPCHCHHWSDRRLLHPRWTLLRQEGG